MREQVVASGLSSVSPVHPFAVQVAKEPRKAFAATGMLKLATVDSVNDCERHCRDSTERNPVVRLQVSRSALFQRIRDILKVVRMCYLRNSNCEPFPIRFRLASRVLTVPASLNSVRFVRMG